MASDDPDRPREDFFRRRDRIYRPWVRPASVLLFIGGAALLGTAIFTGFRIWLLLAASALFAVSSALRYMAALKHMADVDKPTRR